MAVAANSSRAEIARESWLIAAAGLCLFIAGLWHQPFVDFESRFALFAQEMLRHGPRFFPTSYGQPYPDYPVTSTLLIWLCSLPFGAVTKFSAVLPTAIASALNMMLLYRLLAPYSRQWAWAALCLQLMTATFLAEARSISLDQMVATIALLGFYLVHTADIENSESGAKKMLRWLPLVLFAGFAIRGPLGVVIPAAVMSAHCIASANWRRLRQIAAMAIAVLAFAWGAMLIISAQFYGMQFMRDVLRMQVFGRLESPTPATPFQYFTSSFGNYALAYPLAILVAIFIAARLLREELTPAEKILRSLLLWVLIVMIGLSIPHVKKARYLLPIVPALAALAAYPWSDTSLRSLRTLKTILEKLFLSLPALLIVAIAVMHHRTKHHHGGVQIPITALYVLLAMAQVTAIGFYCKASTAARAFVLPAIAALSMWTVYSFAVEAALRQLHDTASFVAQTEALREQTPGSLVLFDMSKDGEAIKYLVNVPADITPQFAYDKNDLARLARPTYIVINDRDIGSVADLLAQSKPVHTGYFDGHAFSVFFLPSGIDQRSLDTATF